MFMALEFFFSKDVESCAKNATTMNVSDSESEEVS